MAPTRTPKTQRKHNDSKTRPNAEKIGHTPGVSKIKASMRQTQRLLAKDTLTPDVRVKTERRLKGLQDELAEAELRNKEKTLSTRYHAIKFFERQKAARRIKQLQKKFESASTKGKQKYTDELFSARVDLNYILNYPRLKKYISLFPPEASEPKPEPQPSSSATDTQRDEMRAQIRKRMLDGELTMEPEKHMTERPTQQRAKPSTKKSGDVSVAAQDNVEEDPFFGDDDDEEELSDGDEDSDNS